MIKIKIPYTVLIAYSAVIILGSCNHNSEIPFPVNTTGYSKPATELLHFSETKKLKWIKVKSGREEPVIKRLDIDALPTSPYDTDDFKSFIKSPESVHFNWDSLAQKSFSIEKLPSNPIKFNISILPPPSTIKSMLPSMKPATKTSILEVGESQGILGKSIGSLLKDTMGFIWVSTEKGLFRYDGENSLQYLLDRPPLWIVQDDFGRIWCIGFDGLKMIDLHNGTISYSTQIKSHDFKRRNILKDAYGRIWICNSTPLGIIIINPVDQTFKLLDTKSGLSGSLDWDVSDVIEDFHRNIWISHIYGGTDIINLEKNSIKYLRTTNEFASDSILAETVDKEGKVWLSVGKETINAVDIDRGIITIYNKQQGINKGLHNNLLCDGKNRIWVRSPNGIIILNATMGQSKFVNESTLFDFFSFFIDNKQRIWGVSNEGIKVIEQNGDMIHPEAAPSGMMIEDLHDRVWLTLFPDGIEIIDPGKHEKKYLNKKLGLTDNFVNDLIDDNDKIWVVENWGLDIIDLKKKIIKQGVIKNFIYRLYKDKDGNIWYSKGVATGLDMYDSSNQTFSHVGVDEGLSGSYVENIQQDKDGRIWVDTDHNGVDVIDTKKGTISYLSSSPGLKDTCNRTFLPDDFGRMWIGTDKGIYVADVTNGTLTTITTKEGLANNDITSLLSYNGSVLAGTNKGINIIEAPSPVNSSKNDWKIFLLPGSLTLTPGADIVTRKGQFQRWNNTVTVINDLKERPKESDTYITEISIMGKPGYFINRPKTEKIEQSWFKDSNYIKDDRFSNSVFSWWNNIHWDSVSGPYSMPVNLRLPHNQNFLQFQFAQAHQGRQDTTWYCYILEGIDKKWSNFTYKTYSDSYLNLLPGSYTFKVSSKNENGYWGKQATFSFTILPPWWETWWAFVTYAILFTVLLGTYIRYLSRKLRRENRLLEEKVSHRTLQLEEEKKKVEVTLEELKSAQAQLIQSEKMASLGELTAGIAHEIQNPLNFVNNFSEVNKDLIEELKTEAIAGNNKDVIALADDISANEEKINHHGRRADAIVKGMLQHSQARKGQKEPSDVNALCGEYLRLSYHGLRAKNKNFNSDYKTDFDESIDKIKIVPQDIGRVLLNVFNNAFYAVNEKAKLSANGYQPIVKVSTRNINSRVEIIVSDNGNGISQKILDKIFQPFFTTKPTGQGIGLGLSLSYDIIKSHGGEIKVETKEGEGSTFIIQLPRM